MFLVPFFTSPADIIFSGNRATNSCLKQFLKGCVAFIFTFLRHCKWRSFLFFAFMQVNIL